MSEIASRTKSYIVLDKSVARQYGRRLRALERLLGQLRHDLDHERALLQTALVELGQERGVLDTRLFARQWTNRQRRIPFDDAPRRATTNNPPEQIPRKWDRAIP